MIKHVRGKYKITIRFNGARFPRTINLAKHQTISFLRNRLEITFDDFDAYRVLMRNTLLNAHTNLWEFEIIKVVEQKGDFLTKPIVDSVPAPLEEKEEEKEEKPKKSSKPKKSKKVKRIAS